jgi:hypothetical protein
VLFTGKNSKELSVVHDLFFLSAISVAVFLFFMPTISNLLSRRRTREIERFRTENSESDIWSFDRSKSTNTETTSADDWGLN